MLTEGAHRRRRYREDGEPHLGVFGWCARLGLMSSSSPGVLAAFACRGPGHPLAGGEGLTWRAIGVVAASRYSWTLAASSISTASPATLGSPVAASGSSIPECSANLGSRRRVGGLAGARHRTKPHLAETTSIPPSRDEPSRLIVREALVLVRIEA
jgi:hypothetical protein